MVGQYRGGNRRKNIEGFPKEETGVLKFAHLPKAEESSHRSQITAAAPRDSASAMLA